MSRINSIQYSADMNDLSHVLIIDDHPLFREALSSAVSMAYPTARSREVSNIEAAISALEADRDYDIALLDLNIPGVNGFEGLLKLRALYPRLPVLVVSGLENEQIIDEAITYGAAGFLPKSMGREVLGTAISTILAGDVYVPEELSAARHAAGISAKSDIIERLLSLTPQQLRVLFMLREGLLNKQIAYELDVGATTVKKHVSEILRKLRVHSRTQAVIEVSKLDQDELFDVEKRFLNKT
ncbi:response regulator transcription factor [bacterium]|nr:response regulator transcription factor [bacterium]